VIGDHFSSADIPEAPVPPSQPHNAYQGSTMLFRHAFVAIVLALASPAIAHEYTIGSLEIDHPNIPAAIGQAPTAAGFLKITNTGSEPDALIAATADFATRTEIHESSVDASGVATMTHIERIEIPAGATVTLEHGGFHVMFMDVKDPPTEGMMLPVTLTFEKAGSIEVEFMVEPRGAHGESSDGHGAHAGHGTQDAPSN
jgi:copper(I)-binding protein